MDDKLKYNQNVVNVGGSDTATKYNIINNLYNRRIENAVSDSHALYLEDKQAAFSANFGFAVTQKCDRSHLKISDSLKKILFTISPVTMCPVTSRVDMTKKWYDRCQKKIRNESETSSEALIERLIFKTVTAKKGLFTSVVSGATTILEERFKANILDGWGLNLGVKDKDLRNDTDVGEASIPLIGKLNSKIHLIDYIPVDSSAYPCIDPVFNKPGGYRGSRVVSNTIKVSWLLRKDEYSIGAYYFLDLLDKDKEYEANDIKLDNTDVSIYVWRNCFELITTVAGEEYAIIPHGTHDIKLVPRRLVDTQTDRTFTRWYMNHKNIKPLSSKKKLGRKHIYNIPGDFARRDITGWLLNEFLQTIVKAVYGVSSPKNLQLEDGTYYDNDLHDNETTDNDTKAFLAFGLKKSEMISDIYHLNKVISLHCPAYHAANTDQERIDALTRSRMATMDMDLKGLILHHLIVLYDKLRSGSLLSTRVITIINYVIKLLTVARRPVSIWWSPVLRVVEGTLRQVSELLVVVKTITNSGGKHNNVRDMIVLFDKIDMVLSVANAEMMKISEDKFKFSSVINLDKFNIKKVEAILDLVVDLNTKYNLLARLRRILYVISGIVNENSDTKVIQRMMSLVNDDEYDISIEVGDSINIADGDEIVKGTVVAITGYRKYSVSVGGTIFYDRDPHSIQPIHKRHVFNDISNILMILDDEVVLGRIRELFGKDEVAGIIKNALFGLEFGLRQNLSITLSKTPLFAKAIRVFDIDMEMNDDGNLISPKF
jgi:hypothetical protein